MEGMSMDIYKGGPNKQVVFGEINSYKGNSRMIIVARLKRKQNSEPTA